MAHTAYDSLHQLLQSLSAVEKEFVLKRFSAKSNHKTESRIHTLYICMQNDAQADDERMYNVWRRKLKTDVSAHAYEKTKSDLKHFMLETLRLQHVPGHDAFLLQRIDFATILSARGLHTDAYKLLQLTEKDAFEFTDPLYACIMNYKMIHLLPQVHEKDKPATVHALMQETEGMIKDLQIYHEVFAFNLEVAMLARQTSVIQTTKHAAQIKKLLKHAVAQTDAHTLPYMAQCTLLKSLSWLHRLQGNFNSAFQYQEKLVNAFAQKETYQMQYRPSLYLAEWADLVNISIKAEKFIEAKLALQKYASLCKTYALTDVFTQLIITNYTLTLQLAQADDAIEKHLAAEQWKRIYASANQIQQGHLLSFLLTVMKCFLALKEYKLLHDAYILILKSTPAERFDVVYAAELIYTLALYHQSKMNTALQTITPPEHFIKQAESFYRRVMSAGVQQAKTLQVVSGLKLLAEKNAVHEHIKILEKMGAPPGKNKQLSTLYENSLFNLKAWVDEMVCELKQEERNKVVKFRLLRTSQ